MTQVSRIQQLKDMLLLEPEDVFLNYAFALELAKDVATYSLAEAQYKRVLDFREDYVPAYYQLGKLSEMQGNTAQAVVYYKTGLQKAKEQKNRKAINELEEAIFLLED